MFYIKWICLNELYKLIKKISSFKFRIFGRKPKIFQKNSEAWIFIKVQCVIYKWIRLNKPYKLMESFFQISESFFKVTKFFFK